MALGPNPSRKVTDAKGVFAPSPFVMRVQPGWQEPGDDDQVASFCKATYDVSFPIMKKSDVNGNDANEVYNWMKSQKSGILGLNRIKWNFGQSGLLHKLARSCCTLSFCLYSTG